MIPQLKPRGGWLAPFVITALLTPSTDLLLDSATSFADESVHAADASITPAAPAGDPEEGRGSRAETAARPDQAALAAQNAGASGVVDASFTDLEGRPRALSETRGGVTLLVFWASWCVPCRKGFPFLDELQRRHSGAGFAVVAVTLEEDDGAVSAFVKTHPASFLVGRDPSGRAGEIFEVGAIPSAFLLNREGRVVARFEGGTDAVHRRIEEAVDTVMSGGTLDPALATIGSTQTNVLVWQREYLADPIMNLDGDVLTRSMREHVHASKEGAAGNGGVAGGGCGCN